MKNIPISKICLMLIAVFAVQLAIAQDAPPPVAPAYEAPAKKTKKKKGGTEPLKPDDYPAFSNETPTAGDGATTPLSETPTDEPQQQITDADYQKPFDLILLYRFLGNYIDSNRAEIKREGESIFYQTEARFPGVIDKYIEVKNKQGVFKYIFYRGNEQSAAETKYREIADITNRVMDKGFISTNRNYCTECSGMAYGYPKNGALEEPYYWVQLVSKLDNVYEVQIIAPINLDPYYLKEVAKPAPVTTSATATSSSTTATSSAPSDICQSLEFLYKSAAKSYDDIRVGDNMVSQDSWPASYMPKGAAEATLSRGTLSRNLYYTAIMHKNTNYETALAFYKKLVDDLKECSFMLFLCKTPVTFSEKPLPSYLKNTDTSMASYLETIADYGFWKRFEVKIMMSKWKYEKDPDLWQVRLEISNNYTGK